MTKKDYERVANVLAGEYAIAQDDPALPDNMREGRARERNVIENITASLADMFAQDNARFNRQAFYDAVLGRQTLRP